MVPFRLIKQAGCKLSDIGSQRLRSAIAAVPVPSVSGEPEQAKLIESIINALKQDPQVADIRNGYYRRCP